MSKWYAILFTLLSIIGILILTYVDKILKWQGDSDTIPMKTRKFKLTLLGGLFLFIGFCYLIHDAFF